MSPAFKIVAFYQFYKDGIQSDTHWQTWAADDTIYSVDGDGQFFGTGDCFCSLSRISGMPLEHRIELVTQFKELDLQVHTPDGMQRYLCGPLAVGTDFYVCVYDYDGRITGKDVSKRQGMLAVDRYSKQGGIPAILHSRDGGKSWSNAMRKPSCRYTPRVYLEMWLFNACVEQYHDRLALAS